MGEEKEEEDQTPIPTIYGHEAPISLPQTLGIIPMADNLLRPSTDWTSSYERDQGLERRHAAKRRIGVIAWWLVPLILAFVVLIGLVRKALS